MVSGQLPKQICDLIVWAGFRMIVVNRRADPEQLAGLTDTETMNGLAIADQLSFLRRP